MPYMSPAAGFSGAIEETLDKATALKHQQLLDTLAQQREANTSRWHDEEVQQRREEAAARRADLLDRANERDRTDFEKRVSGMLPGDQPDAQMVAQDQKYHTGFFKPAQTEPVAPMAGSTTMSGMVSQGAPGGPQMPPMAVGTPQTPMDAPASIAAPAPAGSIYLGNRQDRLQAQKDQKAAAIVARLKNLEPGSPEFLQAIAEHESITGRNLSAQFAKPASSKTRFIFDPIKKVYTDPSGNVVTDLPADAVVDRSAEPKGSSDASEDRKAAHVDSIREHAYTELNNRVKPIEDQIQRLNKLDTSLNAKTDIADSTLAEQLVTLTAGGAGSGVRISQPMIQQVLDKSRTKWEDFDVALRKWNAASADDKNKPSLFFTDTQRQAMRDLAREYRKKANEVHRQITDARHKIDDASDVSSINKARTDLEEMVSGPEPADAGVTPAPFTLPPGVTVTKRK